MDETAQPADPNDAQIRARLEMVRARIADACKDCGRDPASVTLIAVSKTFGPQTMQAALDAGQRVFGENRVQEAQRKWPGLRAAHRDLELHLIGPLQSNKAREAVELFDVIETVDRPKIAQTLAAEMARTGRSPALFVQVNTGAEPQKAGILPQDADAFIADCRAQYGLTLAGLMCIPPAQDVPEPHFALLAVIAARNGLAQLSMGMSADYAAAIGQGATHVRVGSAIFGGRGTFPG